MENRSFLNQSKNVCICLALIGSAAMLVTLDIPRDPDGGLGARVFPMMASGALILLGVAGFFTSVKSVQVGKEDCRGYRSIQIFLLLALSIAYVWLMSKLGYLISTALAAPIILMLFGIRNPLGLLVAAIACPAIYHAIFFVGLGVFPPLGEWFDLLDLFRQ